MNDIKILMDRYLDERMSPAEEQNFLLYLRTADVPDELRDDRELILYLAEINSDVPLPEGIEERLSAAIDSFPQEKPAARIISLLPLWRAAAIIIVILGGIFAAGWQNYEDDSLTAQETDTFSTVEEALPCAKAILNDLAMAINLTRNSATELKEDILLINNILYNKK